jgi:hypothetical protein
MEICSDLGWNGRECNILRVTPKRGKIPVLVRVYVVTHMRML